MLARLARLLLGLALCVGLLATAQAKAPIKIGWTSWSDAEFVTKLAQRLIETRLHRDVELHMAAIAPQYLAVAKGDYDVMLMSWQPETHADYLKRVREQDTVFDLGLLYGHARLGWVVPDYIPKEQLDSIEDLKNPQVRQKLDGTIVGIDPGAGLSRLSKKAVQSYGLEDYHIQFSSSAGMTAALNKAIRRKEWIVVTGWSPHWMFGRWHLRYLKDPKGALGGYERIHALAHIGFYQQSPKVAMFLSRMQLPLDQLQAAMNDAQQTSYEEAVKKYIKEHPKRVNYWITGQFE